MTEKFNLYERTLLNEMKQDNEEAFSVLFRIYYTDMLFYCGSYIREQSECEDIVQNIFFKLWNDRESLNIECSLKTYLLRAVRNSCYDAFRYRKSVRTYMSAFTELPGAAAWETDNYILYSDLKTRLDAVLEKLDDKASEAFRMNRFENLKYKEIAQQLNVSERTIEVRISRALEFIRSHLYDCVLLALFFALS